MSEEQLKKLEEILKKIEAYETLGGDVPTTKEVAELVATIIHVVRETKDFLENQAIENKQDLNNLVNRLTEQEVIKIAEALDVLEKKAEKVVKSINEKTKLDLDLITKNLYLELSKLRNLIPKEADFTEVYDKIKEVESKIVPFELKAEEVVATINDSEELIDRARINGLEEELTAIRNLPRGGGGVGALGVMHAFKYIFHTEEPVGDIDGANTTYTVKNAIWAIIGFTLNGESIAELPNYTFVNHTITFGTALPAAYSGKDFECKYIGH